MDDIEREVVALQCIGNREWTEIAANSWERDRLGRCGVRLAPRSGKNDTDREVFGGMPNPAVERSEQHKSGPLSGLPALSTDQISGHSRHFASIRGWMVNFLIFQDWLTQVVDFHNFSRFFLIVADISACFYGQAWRNPRGRRPCCPKNEMRTKLPRQGTKISRSAQKDARAVGS